MKNSEFISIKKTEEIMQKAARIAKFISVSKEDHDVKILRDKIFKDLISKAFRGVKKC